MVFVLGQLCYHSPMTQTEALDIMKMGHSVLLTGGAGSGKTYLINSYIEYLKQHGVTVAVTASTGIAATHIGGITIHSWSGIGVRDHISDYDLENMESKKYLWDRYQSVKVLIIDEISMLSANYFTNIDTVCRFMKRSSEPFGGLQVILCGDFFQLPPVEKTQVEMRIPDTNSWAVLKPVICYIHEQHRQSDDAFTSILNAIRNQSLTDDHHMTLLSQVEHDRDYVSEYTQLYTHNTNVDSMNNQVFESISADVHKFYMTDKGNANMIETLKKNCLVGEVVSLKQGTQVMCVKNNFEAGYVNGTRGVVTGFDENNGYPIITTTDNRGLTIEPVSWEIINDAGTKVLASITQIPLRHAWAITVHKSQGMSLDGAYIDLSSVFTYGMGYVALSRVRTLSGLKLAPIELEGLQQALLLDPKIALLDRQLQKKSEMAVERLATLDPETLIKKQQAFILNNGGTLNIIKLDTKPAKIKDKVIKGETYKNSYSIWSTGKTIDQVATERGLTSGTIIGHLEKATLTKQDKTRIQTELLLMYPEINSKLLEIIKKTGKKLTWDKMTPIHKSLNDDGYDISYDVLKLAKLIFR